MRAPAGVAPLRRTVPALAVAFAAIWSGAVSGAGSPPALGGQEITVRGPYLCLANHLRQGDQHIGVVYAFDGSGQVQATVREVLAQYPAQAMSVADEQAFQGLLDRELLYYLEPNEVERATHGEAEWWGWPAEVTGVVALREGKRWIAPTAVRPNITLEPPAEFTRADKPLVMPRGEAVVLSTSESRDREGKAPPGGGLSIRCLPIPAGSFVCGSPFWQWPRCHDEYPHEVELSRDSHMSEAPVTQEVFEAVMGTNPTPEARRSAQSPVEGVLWADVQEFCRRVSRTTGRTVRLPTAAEYQYAARVGTSDACFGAKYRDQESDLGNRNGPAMAVKTKRPNAWGLYDMYTFYAWHACSDHYDMYRPGKLLDPQGPPDSPMRKGRHMSIGGNQYGARPNIMYWYDEGPNPCDFDGHWVGIFRVVVEAGPAANAPHPAAGPAPRSRSRGR